MPSDYPTFVIASVHYALHLEGGVLTGTAAGQYTYDTPTTGDSCSYAWDVTATKQ
ncbi:MAG TPA: hypothetical protein VMZ53_24675 [Kofleriaceae bacterium]|nr:hypothetical protein [Kofleriaceae bacterium]